MQHELVLLLTKIHSQSVEVRRRAALELGKYKGEPKVSLVLVEALFDADDDVQARAAFSIARHHDVQALKPLIAKLRDKNTGALPRAMAAKALGAIGHSSSLDVLVENLNHTDDFVVQMTCVALEQISDERAIPSLLVVAENRSWRCSINAIHAVWSMKPSAAKKHLSLMLSDSSIPSEYQEDLEYMLRCC